MTSQLLFLSVVLHSFGGSLNTWIKSPRTNHWGDWGLQEVCPPDHFVNAIMMKYHSKEFVFGDDTTLNGVMLFCTEFKYPNGSETIEYPSKERDENDPRYISSAVGDFGTWLEWKTCTGGVAMGFELQSEAWQGDAADDTAANDIMLLCVDHSGKNQRTAMLDGNYGDWTSSQRCPIGSAICGIVTQVESNQGEEGDDTALNNVDMMCCELPNPAEYCIPTDGWEQVLKQEAPSTKDTFFNLTTNVGISLKSQWKVGESETDRLLEALALNNGTAAEVLKNKFFEATSKTIGNYFYWPGAGWQVWTINGEGYVEIFSPAGCVIWEDKVKGHCGPYEVSTNKFRPGRKCPPKS